MRLGAGKSGSLCLELYVQHRLRFGPIARENVNDQPEYIHVSKSVNIVKFPTRGGRGATFDITWSPGSAWKQHLLSSFTPFGERDRESSGVTTTDAVNLLVEPLEYRQVIESVLCDVGRTNLLTFGRFRGVG